VLLATALASLSIDHQVFNWAGFDHLRARLSPMLSRMEPFGHANGVVAILISIGVAAPHLWRRLVRVAACAVSAGLAADLIKLFVSRTRPVDLRSAIDGMASLSDVLPHWNREMLFHCSRQSFPSGHTAVAFALAFGLSQLFPKGRAVFFILASMVGLQRIIAGRHFPTDVLVGAAVGLSFGVVWYLNARVALAMARWEQHPGGADDRQILNDVDPPLEAFGHRRAIG
jgi:membrane-associated phospholipid phosphatase